MKYLGLGYLEEKRWEAMSKNEQDTFIEECFTYDDVLRKNSHMLGGEALHGCPQRRHPAVPERQGVHY
jgi:hypothetical protein